MEHFEISVKNIIYNTEPQQDGLLKIYEAGFIIALIPQKEEMELYCSVHPIIRENVQKFGEALEKLRNEIMSS